MEDYASALGLTCERVRRWFIERRQRDKQNGANESAVIKEKRETKTKTKRNKRNCLHLELGEDRNVRGPVLLQDMLHSPDYILKKVFRKDGPQLGVEFDPLPSREFQDDRSIAESRCSLAATQDEEREVKRRKVSKPASLDSEKQIEIGAPIKKHGIGKGLMSVLQLANRHASCQGSIKVPQRRKMVPHKNYSPAKRHGIGKGLMTVWRLANPASENVRVKRLQRRKPITSRRSGNKSAVRRKRPVRRGKVEFSRTENQKGHRESCKLALELASNEENLSSFEALSDDEELELRELQAGPNPLTCAHFTTGGSYGCSLCKGLLPKFPPDSVGMKKPLAMHPWDSSLELLKKLFKVFHFLYTYAVIIGVCPFTLNEFAQAFLEKESLLLGKLHICLLGLLLSDIEKELLNGLPIHTSKNCMFRSLLHSVEGHKIIVNFWKKSLNPLTWTEILRQVLVAAGFGSEDVIMRKGCLNKEVDRMVKYGLRPDTLKGELFRILLDQGNKGMKVTELAKSSMVADLNLEKTNGELEDLVSSTLASDITLFEKISPSTYRLRQKLIMKKNEDSRSDNEDWGSIEDESRDDTVNSYNNSECNFGNPASRLDTRHHSGKSSTLSPGTEIDESHPGESWLLRLVEGEYSDLSIEEKLNALLALVDLLMAGSSIKMEDPLTAHEECVPRIYQHGSGGKIKRSSFRQPSLPISYLIDVGKTCGVEKVHSSSELCPVDSSALLRILCRRERSSGKNKDSKRTEIGHSLHPMQSIFLGSDRRYNRYWLFLGPCNADDPGHKRVYFESSEDGHWEVIDSEEALCGLLATLNSQGRREAVLLASLDKRIAYLLEEISGGGAVDAGVCQSTQSVLSEIDKVNEESSSPVSDIDNNLYLAEPSHNTVTSSGAAVFEAEKNLEEQRKKYARLQEYDLWIWNSFYFDLHAVKNGKWPYIDLLTRCGSCHDLYWRDERHCMTCHTTFELDFDLEEKYAIHKATCKGQEGVDVYPTYKVLPSQLQALKAAIHAIELVMPEDALVRAWKKYFRKLWVRRLRRASSLNELLQVLADFVAALNVDWLSQFNVALDCDSALEGIVSCFQNMPQTSSAVASWLVKLDALIASRSDEGLEAGTTKGH